MAFEQNQQDMFNMNNGIDQVKQFQSELDKATASIGAAELKAEEELLGVRLKNLSKQQQTKLEQLGQMLDLEEKSIQELAKLKLTLSNRQFAIRKKEIQKEFQLYKAEAESFYKSISKYKVTTPVEAPKKASTAGDIKASTKNKSADAAIQKADKKVKIATYDVDKLRQDITEAGSSMQELTKATSAAATQNKAQPVQKQATTDSKVRPENNPSTEVKAEVQKEQNFSNDSKNMKEVDLGDFSFTDIIPALNSILTAQRNELVAAKEGKQAFDFSSVIRILESIGKKGEQGNSQTTIDLAGKLVKSTDDAEKSITKLREFNENKMQNMRLIQLTEAQKLNKEHADAELKVKVDKATAYAKQLDLQLNKEVYLAEEENKLHIGHITKQNELRVAGINAEAKAKDIELNEAKYRAEVQDTLKLAHIQEQNKLAVDTIKAEEKRNDLLHNKKLYEQEEEAALNKALLENQNTLIEDLYKTETSIAYTEAHKDELRAIEHQKLINQHAADYDKYLKDILAADEKAKDLEYNHAEYLNKELDNLERGHKEQQNKLTQELINTEAKGIDLKLNKDRYVAEEAQRLQQQFADKENQLLESRHKREAKIAWLEDESNKKKLIAQNLEDLRSQHAENEIKLREAHNIELARAIQLEQDHEQLLVDKIKQLGEEHTKKQNDLNEGLKDADAKKVDLGTNGDAYVYEETLALEKAFRDEQNKLTEDEYKRNAQLDYIEANEKALIEQNLAKLRSEHADEEIKRRQEHIKALAKSQQLEEDRATLLEDAKKKLADEHTNKQNDLKQGAIDNDAKAADLIINREEYIKEIQLELENELAAKRNSLTEDLMKKEEQLKFTAANRDELLALQKQERENKYLDEYNEYLLAAGEYAVDLEKYKANQEKKRNTQAKKDTVNGIVDGLKKFGTGEFSLTDVKEAYGKYMGQRTAELEADGMDEKSAKFRANMELATQAINNLMQALDTNVRKIADMQGFVDTRLQGSIVNEQKGNSYWKQLVKDTKNIAGASPFIKQEKLVDNIKALVDKGISFDIKQRAFLMTIQEKIANTFDVADGTLLRLIRIQQQDTTAGRLGMESALNSFLNSMYETSEYLESVAKNVRSSLEEMQALMEGAAASEIEYQVQKWMGSLYSVGMSDSAVQSIAQAFGQIASGDISGLTGNGAGNLIIMAANEAGKSIADILQSGLDAKETNELMQAMVNYLAEIAETSSDSRVVQQQLANVYGIKASDLRAATNLASNVKDVSKQDLTYNGMLKQLETMMDSIKYRTSISEGMTNMWDNVMYSMASTQASNPILYALPKMANLLKDITGGNGISLPFLNVMGFGVELNTSVAELMMVASMAGTALGALGPLISGIADLATGGKGMLSRAGIDIKGGKIPVLARGSATPLQNLGGASISESGLVGNASGDDIKNATLQDAADSKKKQMVEAKEEESADDTVIKSQQAIIDIYNLLEEVAHGSQSLRVRLVNGSGGSGGGISCNCNHYGSGGEGSIGNTTGNNSTGGGPGSGGDNGNWVLTF